MAIDNFRNEYFFLSNFYQRSVCYDGITYDNNEAAFQAQKTLDNEQRKSFAHMNPSEAKAAGRKVKLRPDWETVKYDLMFGICYAKFTQNTDLTEKLLATGDEELIEGNTWGDRIWGVVNGIGQNHLGKILMQVRLKLKNKET